MRGVYPILVILATGWLLTTGCGEEPGQRGDATGSVPDGAARAEAPASNGPTGPLVVFLGDSLTAGLGLSEDLAYPAVLERRLRESGVPVRVVNAGVSGDTTAGGLARLTWILRQRPDVLVVGLGANDALRGQPLPSVEANLRAIVEAGTGAGSRVLLLGMRIPTNYGPDYAEGFAAIYPRLAKSLGVALVPFLLEGVGGRPALNQADGLHPNARGQEIVAENVFPYLERVLRTVRRARAPTSRAAVTRAGCRGASSGA
ncbi:MAG: arylesterase [Acidobacteriia bacterium]|nr:arylesterase [Terriglobia bacterium]